MRARVITQKTKYSLFSYKKNLQKNTPVVEIHLSFSLLRVAVLLFLLLFVVILQPSFLAPSDEKRKASFFFFLLSSSSDTRRCEVFGVSTFIVIQPGSIEKKKKREKGREKGRKRLSSAFLCLQRQELSLSTVQDLQPNPSS